MAVTKSLLSAALFAAAAHAHGHVKSITSGSNTYTGGLPHAAPADAVGWAAGNQVCLLGPSALDFCQDAL